MHTKWTRRGTSNGPLSNEVSLGGGAVENCAVACHERMLVTLQLLPMNTKAETQLLLPRQPAHEHVMECSDLDS